MTRPIARLLSLPAVLVAALVATACASLDDALPPQVSVADIKFLGSGLFEQEVEVDLRVRNPNNFDLPLEGMTFDLMLNGQHFAEGFTNESVTIPRLGEARVPVTASTSLVNLARQALGIARGGQLDYKINGLAYLRGLTTRTVPYEKSGSLRLIPGSGSGGTETLIPL
ncbi:MAG: LEA type 2 family protein [Kiloniellales bacterium]